MPIKINTDTIAEAVVTRLTDYGVLVPRLPTVDQAATDLGLTRDALKPKVHNGTGSHRRPGQKTPIRPSRFGSDH
jgi:hypothetical protein